MTPQNIAIVVAPNLLWSPGDSGNNIGITMNTASLHSIVLDSLVSYSDWFFPGDYEMFVTLARSVGVVETIQCGRDLSDVTVKR